MAANDWLIYANQGATRNQALDPRLISALAGVVPDMGLSMEVFSGGQPGKGSGLARVGSVRHDHGNAADVFFSRGGQRLDWANPNDLPVFEELVRRAKAAGITGIGAGPGYMQPGSMHIGFGNPGVWGAGGKGENAPAWLRNAYYDTNVQPSVPGNAQPSAVADLGTMPSDPRYAALQMARADGPKGQESYPTPAPPLSEPYEVADRPIGDPMAGGAEGGPRNLLASLFAGKGKTDADKPTMAEALGKGVTGMGTAYGNSPRSMPRAGGIPAARIDAQAPEAGIDVAQADQQRQMLAMALARLNSGRLFV